jgi:hypothetical protein
MLAALKYIVHMCVHHIIIMECDYNQHVCRGAYKLTIYHLDKNKCIFHKNGETRERTFHIVHLLNVVFNTVV